MIEFFISLLVIILCAWLGRQDGQAKHLQIIDNQLAIAITALIIALSMSQFAGMWSIIGFLSVAGLATGHGQYFLGGSLSKAPSRERLDFIVSWFFGDDPRLTGEIFDPKNLYERNCFGLFITGLAVGIIPAIICLIFGQWIAGILFLTMGIGKILSYVISYEFFQTTTAAEWLNAGYRGFVCVLVYLLTA
jgi:hypothetical protein